MQSFITLFSVLFASISDVFDTIVFKKVSEIAIKSNMNKLSLSFIDYCILLLFFFLPISFFTFGILSWQSFFTIITNPVFAFMLIGMSIARITTVNFQTIAYANEKISVLIPYSQVSPMLGIILGFVLFPEITDWRTLIFALLASTILLLSNLQKGKFRFNKFCLIFVIAEISQAIQFILAAKLVQSFFPLSVTLGGVVIGFLFLSIYFSFNFKKLKLPKKEYTKLYLINDGASNLFWIINTLISLFLYKEVGVTLTILLSMISIIASFTAAYLFYKDIPSRKNIIISILIVVCISFGSYFSPALNS
ncbi:MAG: hypothetical protein PHE25_04240 [Candidatus Gracilibacteria bacterium]|nr:hypothetical protein [Candidatus Gracilibacteria bacterium]